MKTSCGVCVVLMALVVSAVAAPESSVLSLYAGRYKGLANFGGAGTGQASATFKASEKKENGSLKVQSLVFVSGSSALVTEKYSFRGKRARYAITLAGDGFTTVGTGRGRARIFKNAIRVRANVFVGGGQAFSLSGVIERSRNRLNVATVLSGEGGVVIDYDLEKRGS